LTFFIKFSFPYYSRDVVLPRRNILRATNTIRQHNNLPQIQQKLKRIVVLESQS
jgi:hypothetical protein